jgi:hypothetical protein
MKIEKQRRKRKRRKEKIRAEGGERRKQGQEE